MSNVFEHIGHDVKVAAEDVAHAAADVAEFLPKASSVIATAIKDEPEVKALILDLVKQASGVIASGTAAVTDKGINLTADASVLASAEAFFGWLKATFVPTVEAIYNEAKTDV
jgi:flagellar hook assembly protein FlgD